MFEYYDIYGKLFAEVCASGEVFEGKGFQVVFPDDEDMQVAVFRVGGKLYCVDNICPHRHAERLFEGIIRDMTVTCPMHGWTYSLETGENTNRQQGIKTLNKYEVFERGGKVFVEKPPLRIPKWRRMETDSAAE